MIKFRTGFVARLLALDLVFTLYVAPGIGSAAALAAAKGSGEAQPKVTLAVLPFDKTVEGGDETLGADMSAAVKSSLEATGKFYVVGFSERLPSIQRAISEGIISKKDIEGEFSTDKAIAARVGRAMGADAALVGSISQIKTDAQNGVAEVTVAVQLVEAQNGKLLNSIVLQGRNPTKPEGASEAELVSLAAGDAATKIATEVAKEDKLTLIAAKPAIFAPEKKKKSKGMKFLLLAILLGAGIALAGGGGGGNSGSDGDEQPPPGPY